MAILYYGYYTITMATMHVRNYTAVQCKVQLSDAYLLCLQCVSQVSDLIYILIVLVKAMSHEDLQEAPLLILANKQDRQVGDDCTILVMSWQD